LELRKHLPVVRQVHLQQQALAQVEQLVLELKQLEGRRERRQLQALQLVRQGELQLVRLVQKLRRH
jgi:hypothetical protein